MRLMRQIVAAVFASVAFSSQAHAFFHLAVIDEVVTSYNGNPAVQFVEIRMLASGQNLVANSVLAAFDAKGTLILEYTVPGDVINSGAGVRWLMGTSFFQLVSGIVPDFVIPPMLLSGGGMVCWGAPGALPPGTDTWDHTDPTQYVDCVAYGRYDGPSNSKIGTPTALSADHHSLQRGTVSNDNNADFSCATSITPQNNAGTTTTLPATAACNSLPINPYDAVLLSRGPLNVTIPSGSTSKVANLTLKVRNLSASSQTLNLQMVGSTCPAGVTIGDADFVPKTPITDGQVLVEPGKTKSAKVIVTVDASAFTNFNHKAPSRCEANFLVLEALNPGPDGSFDTALSNNFFPVVINVTDRNDSDQTGSPESFIKSIPTKLITVPVAAPSKTVNIVALAGNGDPSESGGHSETLSVSPGTCSRDMFATPDFDSATTGSQPSLVIAGGKTKPARIATTANASRWTSAGTKSPARCRARAVVTGTSEPEVSPRDPSNGSTPLVIDVVDKNDF